MLKSSRSCVNFICQNKVNISGIRSFNVNSNPINILGIETSCDDTGVAIVNGDGHILGEEYYSQAEISVRFGGVLPSIAQKFHKKYINIAVHKTLRKSQISPGNLTAVAVTVKPGIRRTLTVGTEYGKEFAVKNKLPFIPIHHMEAHALMVRLENKVEFPFVVLLVSGGHCVLALAQSIDEWSIIGETTDISPGCSLDQIARRMKLRNLKDFSTMIGGKAIEMMATKGDPQKYSFPSAMTKYRDSNFSFSGLESFAKKLIVKLEEENGVEGGTVLKEASDLCASFQYGMVKHMVRKTHRGLKFLEHTQRIPSDRKTLVISGGVASNQFLRAAFASLCSAEGYRLLVPPPHLCTDNGVMIAWNGVERWKAGKGVIYDEREMQEISIQHKSPLGVNLSEEQRSIHLANPKWIKII